MKDISSLDELREKADGFIKHWGPNYFMVYEFMGPLKKCTLEAKKHRKSLMPGWMK